MVDAPAGDDRVRAAEVIAALSLATDLGMGLPFEHGLQSTLVAMRLADRLDVDPETASSVYYGCLLFYVGCTADAELNAELFDEGALIAHFTPVMFGTPLQIVGGIMRALTGPDEGLAGNFIRIAGRLPRAVRGHQRHVTALCEVAVMLTARLGLPASVQDLFRSLTERWDGKGDPGRLTGEEVPLPLRIMQVARDATFQRLLGGTAYAADIVRDRGGHAFDPDLSDVLADEAEEILRIDDATSAWDEVIGLEPAPGRLSLQGPAIDRALAAIADFADLISPYLVGHSSGVAELAAAAGHVCGLSEADVVALRRAALIHDVGRVGIPAGIWLKPGPLTQDELERVRLHAYHSERILRRSPFLAALAPVASAHHERMDGTGYHRGATAAALPPAARLLAAADTYHSMTEPRPYRDALSPTQAADALGAEAHNGRLDTTSVDAVLAAAGHRVRRLGRPAGLTDRETQVVALLARGLQTKQIARELGISVKTADRHLQNAYPKIGVSTRAAATLFAMEHGLVGWGEFPMARPRGRS